jgi:CRP/FNR family transcriptional regulator, cyclic AMP receptor protein
MKLGKNSKVDLIRHVPLFASCTKKELAEIASIADEIDLPEGKVLMEQGEQGREFFVLIDGTVDVIQDDRTVKSMGPGDFFGEIALVTKVPRSATVKATSPLRALVISDRAFRALLDHSPKIQLSVLKALAERVGQTSLP